MGDYTKRFQKRDNPQAQAIKLLDRLVKGKPEELIDYFAHERPEGLTLMATVLVENKHGQVTLGRLLRSMGVIAKDKTMPSSQLEEVLRATGETVLLHTSMAEGSHAGATRAGKTSILYLQQKQENEAKKNKYFNLAYTDTLTQIPNRLMFMDKIHTFHQEAENYRDDAAEAYSMIHFDLDHFKEINDGYGHPAGDAALITFVERVKASMLPEKHPNDVFARIGGDEFGLLLPRTTERGAKKLADRVLSLVNALPLQFKDHAIPLKTSIGVWQYQPRDTFDDVITAADDCMYIAKKVHKGNHVITGSMAAKALTDDGKEGIEIRESLSPLFKERLLRYSSEPNKI